MANECESMDSLSIKHPIKVRECWSVRQSIICHCLNLKHCGEHRCCFYTAARRGVTNRIEARLGGEECCGEPCSLLDTFAAQWPLSVGTDPLRRVASIRVSDQVEGARRALCLRCAHGFRSSTSPETR